MVKGVIPTYIYNCIYMTKKNHIRDFGIGGGGQSMEAGGAVFEGL